MKKNITESCKTLKQLGLAALKDCWAEAIIFALICELIMNIPGIFYDLLPAKLQLPFFATAVNVYGLVISGPTTLGFTHYVVNAFKQKENHGLEELKFGFANLPKAMSLFLCITILKYLLSCLFIIPGIICAINYSQAFFILEESPNKGVAQCMFESKFLMRGNRVKFFSLDLSMIGWYLLSLIPSIACYIVLDGKSIAALYTSIPKGMAAFESAVANFTIHPIVNILTLLAAFPTVYLMFARAAFFDILTGKLETRSVDDINNGPIEVNATVIEDNDEQVQ